MVTPTTYLCLTMLARTDELSRQIQLSDESVATILTLACEEEGKKRDSLSRRLQIAQEKQATVFFQTPEPTISLLPLRVTCVPSLNIEKHV